MIDGFFHPHDTSRSLPMALLRSREAVMARFRPMLNSHGITDQQWRVVRVLAEADEIEVSQVAERTSILGPSLSRILRTLEQQKLVSKRQDANDGRKFWVTLTGKGKKLIDEVQPDAVEIYRQIEAVLGKEEIDSLLDILQNLTDTLKTTASSTG